MSERVAVLIVLGWLVAGAMTGSTAGANPRSGTVPQERNCLWQLANGSDVDLVCDWPAFLGEKERKEVRAFTRDLVQDAGCLVSVRIDRRLIEDALAARDHAFQAPPQRVTCNVHTNGTVMPVSGTFSPRVVVKNGRAIEASPGLGEIQGVHAALAAPVVEYVNKSASVRDGMLKVINRYLGQRGGTQP